MTRCQKTLKMSAEIWADWLKSTCLGADLPDDVTVRGARFDPFHNLIEFLVESSEFPEVAEGAEPGEEIQ